MGLRSVASHSPWDDRFDRDELGLDPEDDVWDQVNDDDEEAEEEECEEEG